MSRKIGLDILKIMCMLGIIGLHILGAGGILDNVKVNSSNFIISNLLQVLFLSSVNIFAILSGYLYVDREDTKKKNILNIVVLSVFYSVIFTSIFYILNLFDFRTSGFKIIGKSLIFPLSGTYWYVTAYLFLFLMIPYLNIFIKNLKENQYKKLLIILFILLSFVPSVGCHDFFRTNYGYSGFWLMYCYILGAYIKKYYNRNNNKKILCILLISILFTLLWKVLIINVMNGVSYRIAISNIFMSYVSPTILINSICVVILFKDVNIKFTKVINMLSLSSFSVYLIHNNFLINKYVMTNAFVDIIEVNVLKFLLYILISMISIYFICTIIDIIRLYLFKIFKVDILLNKIGNWLDKLLKIDMGINNNNV